MRRMRLSSLGRLTPGISILPVRQLIPKTEEPYDLEITILPVLDRPDDFRALKSGRRSRERPEILP